MSGRVRLPDFIIGGAMKSGTTTLHHMLASQPGVFIPDEEIFFFDIDDYEQHPEFFADRAGKWVVRDFGIDGGRYLEAYASRFMPAPGEALIGEDSTTYLASRKSPERIARMIPEVRMIFLLRDPASRAYSHYWHLMRTGRATRSFEAMLRHEPGTMIQRSLYREQVARYLAALPREQLHIVAFERLIREPMTVLGEVGRFLGFADPRDVPPDAQHRNRAMVPRLAHLQRIANMLRSKPAGAPLERAATAAGGRTRGRRRPLVRQAWFSQGRIPPMQPDTRTFLNGLFRMENRGLDELVGGEFEELWYPDAHTRDR